MGKPKVGSPTGDLDTLAFVMREKDAKTAEYVKRFKSLHLAGDQAAHRTALDAWDRAVDQLSQTERRAVYDALGWHNVSAAPRPLKPDRPSSFNQIKGNASANLQSAIQEPISESISQRRTRRLKRFRILGGELVPYKSGPGQQKYKSNGKRGALSNLANEEAAAGKRMADKKNVREDLIAALEAETKTT